METTLAYYHLGSWTTITGEDGEIYAEQSFDAWGNPRDPETWMQRSVVDPRLDRGFTGHEHLFEFGLINMNGRMYDPVMSTFLSVDNYVQSPDNSQNFNRYAYCLNNPLKYTDPDGEWFLTFGLDYGKNSNGNFGVTGLSLGINFGTFGFGTHFNWGNGFTAGLYGEVGPHIGCAGVNATLGFDYNFTYGTSTLSLSGGYGASYGIGRASLGGNVSYTFGLPAGVNGFNANVTAGLGLAGNINKFGQQAGFGLSGSYGTSGWSFGAHSYCEMIPAQEKLNRIVDYYKDELAAVGDADATVQVANRKNLRNENNLEYAGGAYMYDKIHGKYAYGATVSGEEIHTFDGSLLPYHEGNRIYLSRYMIRRMWKNDTWALGVFHEEWFHSVDYHNGVDLQLIDAGYNSTQVYDILEFRANMYNFLRTNNVSYFNKSILNAINCFKHN